MNELLETIWEDLTSLSSNIRSSLIIIVFLMIMAVIIGNKVSKLKPHETPRGLAFIGVTFVGMINEFLKGFFNEKWKTFAPFLLTIFLFVAFSNIISLLGLSAPFANISVALSFSVLAFGSIQIMAIRQHGLFGRIKNLSQPAVPMIVLNLIGEMSTPLAMGLRLFGNLISGAVIATIVYGAAQTWYLQIFAGAAILHPIFDLGFGLIQAFVFFMLFTIFLSMAVED